MKHTRSFLLKSFSFMGVFLVASIVLVGCTLSEKKDTDDNEAEEQIEDDSTDDMDDDEDIENTGSYEDITPVDAQKLIDENNDLLIVDVSPKYGEGHLLNSVNYYVGDGSLDEVVSELDKDRTYLVYCHVDSASILGAEKLVEAGMKNVYRLEGNYSAWTEAGYPIIANISEGDGFLRGNLDDVVDGDSNGEGYIARDSKLSHKVVADMPDIDEGKFYEGWLVNKSKGSDFFSTGKMVKIPGNEWLLEYTSSELNEGYDYAVITLETEDDGEPEEHIIEGNIE